MPSDAANETPTDNTADSQVTDTSSEDLSGNDFLSDDVRAAKDFDPFTPEDDESAPAEGTENTTDNAANPASADGPETPSEQPASETPEQTAEPGGSQTAEVDVTQLLKQTNDLVNVVLNKNGDQTQAQSKQEEKPVDPLKQIPDYVYDIPDPLLQAMNSEDPAERKQGMQVLIQGVAKGIHERVAHAAIKRIEAVQAAVPQMIQAQMQSAQTAQTVSQDFYGKYPQLNNPALKPLIQTVAKQYMETVKATTGQEPQWNEQLRDEIAKKVIEAVSGAIPQNADVPPQQPAANSAPPQMFGGNAQPANSGIKSGPRTQADHMNDVFGNF